jgi:hypothetical protein
MKYTKESPTQAGWYWIKSDIIGELPIEVFTRPNKPEKYLYIHDPSCCQHTKRNFLAVLKLDAEWSDKIIKPNS